MVYRGLRTVSLSMTHTQQASSSFFLSSPLSLSSVAQKARDNKCVCACVSKYVWLQEATENADWAVCMHVSIFVSLCLCMLILLCVCVGVKVAVQEMLVTSFSALVYHCRNAQKPFVRGFNFIVLSLSLSFYLLPSRPAPYEPLHTEKMDLRLWSSHSSAMKFLSSQWLEWGSTVQKDRKDHFTLSPINKEGYFSEK